MGIVFRQSIKATIAVFGGAALGAGILFIGSRILSPQQLGLTRNLINQAGVLQYLALLGFNHVLATFMQRYAGEPDRQRVLLTVGAIIPAVVCLLCTLPYFLLRDFIVGKFQAADAPLLDRYYALVPLLVLLWGYMTMAESYLISEKRIAVSAFAKEVVLKGGNLFLIVLFGIHAISFSDLVGGMVLLHILPTVIMLASVRNAEGFGWSTRWSVFGGGEWKQIAHFAWYHLLSGITLTLVSFIDALMLAPLDKQGLGSLAVYSVAGFIAVMLTMPLRAMATAAFPVLNEAFIAQDTEKVRDVFKRSAINITIASVCLAAIIIPNLFTLVQLLPPAYAAVVPLTTILILGRLTDATTGMNSEIISISPYYKFLFRISVLLIVVLAVSNRILIPRFGFYGAAWGTTLSLMLFNIGKVIFLWLRFRLQPFSPHTALVLLSGGLAAFAGWMLPDVGSPVVAMTLRSAVIIAVYLTLLFWWKPSPDLRTYLASIRKNKRLF